MSKKKKKSSQKRNISQVRLSQCMIVKNEEKNIEKALSWAKDVAYEQIIVDTGSTDRTVEIAEKMGAKICHFKWIDDFSAAKNYAMDQAKGDWIAILDADEYIPPEDVKELMILLNKLQASPQISGQHDSINCSWVQLNDEGNVHSVLTQVRFFKNRKDLRYEGRIHEAVKLRSKPYNAENLRIMHTGYALSSFGAADKRERNIKLLKEEHERDPSDPHILFYLADTIKSDGTDESRTEAESLYIKGLKSKKPADPAIKRIAYDFLIPRFAENIERNKEALKLCDEAIAELPNHVDYYYYRALINNKNNNFNEAMVDLVKCESIFLSAVVLPETRILVPSPLLLFYQLSIAAKGLGDEHDEIKYSAVVNAMLMEGKNKPQVLGPYLVVLFKQKMNGLEVFEKLAPVYDINDPRDMLMIARTAKDYGILLFAQMIMDMIGDKFENNK